MCGIRCYDLMVLTVIDVLLGDLARLLLFSCGGKTAKGKNWVCVHQGCN